MMFTKKILTLFLVVCMFISLLSVSSFAAETGEASENDDTGYETKITDELKEDSLELGNDPDPEPDPEPDPDPDPESDQGSDPDPDPSPNPEVSIIQPIETIPENPSSDTSQEEMTGEIPEDKESAEKKPVFTEIPEEEKHFAVYLNEEGYESLQEAINAAGERDSDIYLHEPVEEDIEIGKDQIITISLNGYGFSGEMVNFGSLTILGEGFFEGSLFTRAYHIKEGGETVDFASGRTLIKNGMFSGILAVEQKSDALLENDDPLPQLIIEGGTFVNEEGEELIKRYVSWNESGNPEYSESDDAGEILLTGGVFAHYPAYAVPGYHAVDYGGLYGIEEGRADDQPDNNTPEETEIYTNAEPVTKDSENIDEVKISDTDLRKEITTAEQTNKDDISITEKPVEKETLINVDLFVYGNGTIVYDGEEYGNNDTIQVAKGESLKAGFTPDGNGSIRNVTVGTNGYAIPYGAAEEIEIEDVENYMTITAMFGDPVKHTLTVYYNNSNGTVENENGETIPSGTGITVEEGKEVILHFVAAEGFYVSTLTVDGEEKEPDDELVLESISGDCTINVSFAPKVTVAYSRGYEPEEIETVFSIPGETITLKDRITRGGYIFRGWECSLDSKTYDANGEYQVEQDVEFVAQWEPVKYTLTYVMNNSAVAPFEPVNFTIEDTFDLEKPVALATFLGWYEDSTFSGSPVTQIPKGTVGNIVVYGKWETCTVVFNPNDGTATTSQTVIPGNPVTLPAAQRNGYQFLGWLSSEDSNVYGAGNYIPKGNVTLTAQWEKLPTYYRIYVYYNTFGTVSYNGSVIPNRSYFEVEEGDSLTMYFNPLSTSYYPYNCTVNNVKKGSISSLTLENIQDNQVVSVTFAPTFARPMTGDSSHLLFWTGLMAFSGVAAVVLVGRKKKKQQ